MSGISKLSAGPSLASFRSIGSEMKAPQANPLSGQQGIDTALKALSQNPILRSLLGENAFDGVMGKGKTEKAQATEQAKPQEALQKILDTLKQLVSVLKTLAGEKGGKAGEKAGGAEGAQQAGGAEGGQGAQQAGGAEGAQQAGPAAAEEDDEKDPIKKLIKALEKIVETLGQLVKALGGQAAPAAPTTGGATTGGTTSSVGGTTAAA